MKKRIFSTSDMLILGLFQPKKQFLKISNKSSERQESVLTFFKIPESEEQFRIIVFDVVVLLFFTVAATRLLQKSMMVVGKQAPAKV